MADGAGVVDGEPDEAGEQGEAPRHASWRGRLTERGEEDADEDGEASDRGEAAGEGGESMGESGDAGARGGQEDPP